MNETYYADGHDDAILGVETSGDAPRVVYSKEKMIECYMRSYPEVELEDAIYDLSFNTWGVYMGEGTPIYVEDLTKEEIDIFLDDW